MKITRRDFTVLFIYLLIYLFVCSFSEVMQGFSTQTGAWYTNLRCCTLSVIVPVVSNDLSSTDAH